MKDESEEGPLIHPSSFILHPSEILWLASLVGGAPTVLAALLAVLLAVVAALLATVLAAVLATLTTALLAGGSDLDLQVADRGALEGHHVQARLLARVAGDDQLAAPDNPGGSAGPLQQGSAEGGAALASLLLDPGRQAAGGEAL